MQDINEARKEVVKKANEGGGCCPVCGQFVKVYRRSITSTMARQLIKAYKMHGIGREFHTSTIVMGTGSGDFTKLEHWGFIEESSKDVIDSSKKRNGYWKVTQEGKDFVLNKLIVNKYAFIYNKNLMSFDPSKKVNIKQVLGNKFNYKELMKPSGFLGFL